MATVFHERADRRFIEIKGNLRRKKLHKTNLIFSNFLVTAVAIGTKIRARSKSKHLDGDDDDELFLWYG